MCCGNKNTNGPVDLSSLSLLELFGCLSFAQADRDRAFNYISAEQKKMLYKKSSEIEKEIRIRLYGEDLQKVNSKGAEPKKAADDARFAVFKKDENAEEKK